MMTPTLKSTEISNVYKNVGIALCNFAGRWHRSISAHSGAAILFTS